MDLTEAANQEFFGSGASEIARPVVADIVNTVMNKTGVVLVGHSQGNLFVNPAYKYALTKTTASSVKVVHVAPASPTLSGSHTLADLDLVINGLRIFGSVVSITDFIPGYLLRPAGVNGKKDQLGHGLLEIYINQALAVSNRVKTHINTALNDLVAPTTTASCIRPAWEAMALPYRLEGLLSNGCRYTERVDADGQVAFGSTTLIDCGGYREVVTNNIKTEGYRLYMSPTRSYFKLFPTLADVAPWFPGRLPNVTEVRSVTGSLTIDYRARRAEVLDLFLRREVECASSDSSLLGRGMILVKGEELWLSRSTGESRLGPLPGSSEDFPLTESYNFNNISLTDLINPQPDGVSLDYTFSGGSGSVNWINGNVRRTCWLL